MSQRGILKSSGRNKELNPEQMSKVEICRSEIIIRAKHKSTKQHDGTIFDFTFLPTKSSFEIIATTGKYVHDIKNSSKRITQTILGGLENLL